MKNFYVYILSNKTNSVVYTGVTNDLRRRLYEHKNKIVKGFTEKYNVNKLVFYTSYNNAKDTICFEKQIKGWKREKKDALINSVNPDWKDLSEDWE